MKALIAATPLIGHVYPLLAVGRPFAALTHGLVVTTGPAFARRDAGHEILSVIDASARNQEMRRA